MITNRELMAKYEFLVERLYAERDSFRRIEAEDLEFIHELKAENVEGYENLNETNKRMFRAFFVNYINCCGIQTRIKFKALSVRYCFGKAGQDDYLRFDYKVDRKAWLHVLEPNNWY